MEFSKTDDSIFNKFLLNFNIIMIIIINVLLEGVQIIYDLPLPWKIILSNLQIVFLLIASYKFLLKGFLISLIFNMMSGAIMYLQYQQINEPIYMQMSSYRFIIIFLSGLISFLSIRQKKYISQLESNSYLDSISEVFNHRYFQGRIDSEFIRSVRNKSVLGLIMVDIDNFKKYNDTYGHNEGDILLRETAKVIQSVTRIQDVVCRYGADEFAIILSDIKEEVIVSISERIRQAFTEFSENNGKLKEVNVSLSIGYSIYPQLALTRYELISQADNALYHAKQLGKNNIKVYKDIFNDIKHQLNSTETQLFTSLKTLLGTVSAKDRYTLGHSERVMDYAVSIGETLGLDEKRLQVLKIASLIHDVGKVEIPQEILNKKERLTNDEFEIIKKHPVYSADIIEPLSNLGQIHQIVRSHHECYDGTGYPDGIKGEDIPIEARILTVADSFDAMLSKRPYRSPFTKEEAITELIRCSGKQFDKKVVNAFIKNISE